MESLSWRRSRGRESALSRSTPPRLSTNLPFFSFSLPPSKSYFLKAIEWSRKYGLRINLDLHAVPGSQNGWSQLFRFPFAVLRRRRRRLLTFSSTFLSFRSLWSIRTRSDQPYARTGWSPSLPPSDSLGLD